MRRFRVLSALALVGCASTNGASSPAASPQETFRVSPEFGAGSSTIDTHPMDRSARIPVDFTVDRVWSQMKPAYDSLGIPITTLDPASHTIGNTSLRVRRRLGDVSMSKYVNCGNVQGVQSADSYEVIASIVTRLQAGESPLQTMVMTTVEAQGRPMTISSEYVRCTSTGVLETRLSEIVTAQLKR